MIWSVFRKLDSPKQYELIFEKDICCSPLPSSFYERDRVKTLYIIPLQWHGRTASGSARPSTLKWSASESMSDALDTSSRLGAILVTRIRICKLSERRKRKRAIKSEGWNGRCTPPAQEKTPRRLPSVEISTTQVFGKCHVQRHFISPLKTTFSTLTPQKSRGKLIVQRKGEAERNGRRLVPKPAPESSSWTLHPSAPRSRTSAVIIVLLFISVLSCQRFQDSIFWARRGQ